MLLFSFYVTDFWNLKSLCGRFKNIIYNCLDVAVQTQWVIEEIIINTEIITWVDIKVKG